MRGSTAHIVTGIFTVSYLEALGGYSILLVQPREEVTDHKSRVVGLLTKRDVVRTLGSLENQTQPSAQKGCRNEP
jgi:hypothetical protein